MQVRRWWALCPSTFRCQEAGLKSHLAVGVKLTPLQGLRNTQGGLYRIIGRTKVWAINVLPRSAMAYLSWGEGQKQEAGKEH